MPAKEYKKAKTGLAVLTLFMLFAGESIRAIIGWELFMTLVGVVSVAYIVLMIRLRSHIQWRSIPFWLAAFVLIAVFSVIWAYSPVDTALTLTAFLPAVFAGVGITLTLPWADFVRALGTTFRWILGLSLLFEVWVSAFVGHPIYPVWVDVAGGQDQPVYQWSRNLLFDGGPIQGIVGNRNQLGFIAVLALIVFCIQLAEKIVWRSWTIIWIAVALGTLALTRSTTDILALIVVAVMTAFALWARAIPQSRRWPLYATAAGLAVAGWALVTYAQGFLLQLAGKSDDLTGRVDTWANVIALAEQRPVLGWGWLSPWVPWLEPFNTLAVRNGVTYLQAHNTWLDVWMQLGWVGILALGMTVLGVFWRSWFIAVDRPRWGLEENLPYSAHSLLPLLFMSALVLQSFAESQLIVQSGLALLVILSLTTMAPERITRSSLGTSVVRRS